MFIGKIYDKAKPNKKPEDSNDEEMDNREHDSKQDWSKQRRKTMKKRNSVDSLDDTVDTGKTEKKKSKKETNSDKSLVERINEKVKSFKKSESSQIKNTKTIQSVYSIPLENNDVEKGITNNNIKNVDKFETVDLNSEDSIKEYYTGANKKSNQNLNYSSDKCSTGNVSVGIQASPYPPFRLHVLPSDDWRDAETLCLKLVKLVVCQCGLASIVLMWALFGALMFHLTEAPHEYWHAQELTKQQASLVVGLATDLRQVVPEEPVWRTTIEKYAAEHESLILSAVSAGYPQIGTIWTYPGCLLFGTSLLTTLGFGAPVPRTIVGRISAIIFAALGVPMHLLLILNVGLLCAVKLHHLARVSQRKYVRLRARIRALKSRKEREWPEEIFTPDPVGPPPPWIKYFPFCAIPVYYLTGLTLFGIARGKSFPGMFLFPLDFTLAGGVASTHGFLRLAYAIYLEGAVILASTNVALLRVSATRGFTSLALKYGLMTNSLK